MVQFYVLNTILFTQTTMCGIVALICQIWLQLYLIYTVYVVIFSISVNRRNMDAFGKLQNSKKTYSLSMVSCNRGLSFFYIID